MSRSALLALLVFGVAPLARAAVDCSAVDASLPAPLSATVVAPAAAELYTRVSQLGMPAGVLATSYDEAQSLDRVLHRLRAESCRPLAGALPAAGTAQPGDPAAYKPQTAYDNTPWRFDMNQNGKRMTADEFDAWMKARGVRVVKARAAVEPAPEAAAQQQ